MMKHEWRKHEKSTYLPKQKPEVIDLPSFSYFTIKGEGNPNDEAFSDCIQALFAVSYTVKMSYKSDHVPEDYYDYTVYPLEGIWDLKDPEKGALDKSNFVFELMIRQPSFLTEELAKHYLALALKTKKIDLISKVEFKTITEGKCIQMLHVGPYDNEPASFAIMENFAVENGYTRLSKVHKEVYLSDFRKTEPDKLKTVLRFKVQ